MDEDDKDLLLQAMLGSKGHWPNLPRHLRLHFSGVKMHAATKLGRKLHGTQRKYASSLGKTGTCYFLGVDHLT